MINKYLLTALGALAMSMSVGTAQSAMRVSGASGHQWPNPGCAPFTCGTGDATLCFEHAYGMMENRCYTSAQANTRLLVIPLPMTNSAAETMTFGARFKGNGVNATTCQMLVIDGNDGVWASGSQSVTSATLTNKYWGPWGSVPSDTVAQVECQVPGPTAGGVRAGLLRVTY